MVDEEKTRAQLISEAAALRRRVAELETLGARGKQAGAGPGEALQESRHFVQRIADATPNILYVFDLGEQ